MYNVSDSTATKGFEMFINGADTIVVDFDPLVGNRVDQMEKMTTTATRTRKRKRSRREFEYDLFNLICHAVRPSSGFMTFN